MWLLWKKSSQVKTNNKKKDDLLQETNRLLFRIDKGKYAENLDADQINKVGEKIRQYVTNLEYTTFTCDDNIDIVIGKIQESVKHLREALDGGLASRVNSATEDLAYYFDVLISGNFNALNSDDEKTLRQSSLQRGLSEKIRELVSIKEFASAKKAELSRDIKKLRLEKEELEDRLCEEDDDDLANDIDRQISANEEIIKTKSASFHSYSVCETRLESLYNYAKEACDAGEDQVRKVNAYLDMEKIRAVTSDPSSLDTVWQRINSEIELLEGKVRKSDENRARQNMGNSSTISSSAAKRREELRNRKRQKEENAKNMETIDHILDGKDTTVTQEVK